MGTSTTSTRRSHSSACSAKPYLDRRTLGFFVGWSNSIFEYPYFPSARSRFLPVLIASTFVDYYNFSLVVRVPTEREHRPV